MCPIVRNVDAFIYGRIREHARCEDAGSVRISLPKIGEGSGGVDVGERLFAGPSRLGEIERVVTSEEARLLINPAAAVCLPGILKPGFFFGDGPNRRYRGSEFIPVRVPSDFQDFRT